MINFLKQSDKQLHMLGCFILTSLLLLVLPMLWAAPIVLFVGFAKERLYDWYHPLTHTADWFDVLADAIGMAVACAVFTIVIFL